MFRRNINPVRRRNSLLLLSGMFLMMALINKPSMLLFFISAKEFVSIIAIAFAAFMATIGIYQYADRIFGRTEIPWYARPWAMIFLAVALIIINAMFMLTIRLISKIVETGFVLHNAHIYLFMAFEVAWIVLLEWVNYKK